MKSVLSLSSSSSGKRASVHEVMESVSSDEINVFRGRARRLREEDRSGEQTAAAAAGRLLRHLDITTNSPAAWFHTDTAYAHLSSPRSDCHLGFIYARVSRRETEVLANWTRSAVCSSSTTRSPVIPDTQ